MLKRLRSYLCISMMLLPAWIMVAASKGQLQSIGDLSAERPMLVQQTLSQEKPCSRERDFHLAM